MIDVRKAEIGDEFNRDMKSQFDQLNNKIDKLADTLTDKLNCEILLNEVERFLEVILDGILKIMSVQSIRVDVIPVVIIIILLKIAHVTNPDHLHHERCS